MRYPGALWRPVQNHGGALGATRLGVLHTMEGTLAGTDSWFRNPESEVSAHFGVGREGLVYQWVDTALAAWHASAYNYVSIGVELEGYSTDALTGLQFQALAALMAWLPVALVRSDGPYSAGWLGHSELGAAGGGHGDPGPVILAELPELLAMARHTPVVAEEDEMASVAVGPDGTVWVTARSANGNQHLFARKGDGRVEWYDLTASVEAEYRPQGVDVPPMVG